MKTKIEAKLNEAEIKQAIIEYLEHKPNLCGVKPIEISFERASYRDILATIEIETDDTPPAPVKIAPEDLTNT